MSICDYCWNRCSSLIINCLKCSPSRGMKIYYLYSINVNQLREHAKHHPLSTYEINDIPLDENSLSEWLFKDEFNLIEMIESYGLGNWNDIAFKMSKTPQDCQNHFEDIYFSRLTSPYSIDFQSFPNLKQLSRENQINGKDFQIKSFIYPPIVVFFKEWIFIKLVVFFLLMNMKELFLIIDVSLLFNSFIQFILFSFFRYSKLIRRLRLFNIIEWTS
jgi:hypothetical protein